ncbi:MAG TPA: hypothetical protein VFX43_00335 [Chitinophagaceae bacterium]|nr:hypothetical protein [Chitinophagaceae bacterium]
MEIRFEHIEPDSNLRGYQGLLLDNAEFTRTLQGPVCNNLVDIEVQQEMLLELTGLLNTGFSQSESLLTDIRVLESENPEDLREWRIGEALAEVILEEKFQCRFHWNELRDARNPKANKAGADLVGFIESEGSVLFLFGEVKTSSETANRPPQVMTKADGIENQLKALYNDKRKRQILITYLKSKTRDLPDSHPFQKDYNLALRSYYTGRQAYQLIGILVRDIESDHRDISISYHKMKAVILHPIGIKLIALYTSVQKSNWHSIITSERKQ